MAKYFKSSDYCPDDKDIFDFLDTQTRGIDRILNFLKTRNIFASKNADKEQLQKYTSLLFFDWESTNQLVDIVDIRENEHKRTNNKYSIEADLENIKTAAQTVKTDRCDKCTEVYKIVQIGDDLDITVDYIDIDYSKTRVLQKKEKELQITATPTKDGWSFRYTDCDRASDIIKDILKKITEITQKEPTQEKTISIGHIIDNKNRVSFFRKTMEEMEGFRFIGASNLKVDKLNKNKAEEDDSEDQEIIEDKIKRIVMFGSDLFTTSEFQELVGKGFFISGAEWSSEKNKSSSEQIIFSASFKDPSEGKGFVYKVMGKQKIDIDGDLKSKKKIDLLENREYLSALEKSAYNALASIEGEDNEAT